MGTKLFKIILSVFLIIVVIAGIRYFVTIPNNVEVKVAEIQSNFEGIIMREFKVRDTDKPTHLEVKIDNGNKVVEISPNQAVIDYADVGDSIIKPRNENTVYIKKLNGQRMDFFYTKLSYDTRSHRKFPEEWKNKWLRSSEWDLKN